MAFTYAVDFKETNTQYIFMDICSSEFYPHWWGGGHTKFGQNSTYAPRDSRQRCIFVLNFLQAVVMKWHKHTHIHIFLRQDQPLLGAEKTNSKKPMEVYNFCEGTTYFCRM